MKYTVPGNTPEIPRKYLPPLFAAQKETFFCPPKVGGYIENLRRK